MLENAQEYAKRREHLCKTIGFDAIAIIPAANEYLRNGDSHYLFRQNSDLYYLTGFVEPEAVAVFVPGRQEGEFIFFSRPRDPASEVWDGPRAGQQGAKEIYGADSAFPIHELDQHIPRLLENRQSIYYPIGRDMAFNRRVLSWLSKVQAKVRSGVQSPQSLFNIENIVHEMRLIKSEVELNLMREAAHISAAAHLRAIQHCRPGMMEYQLEAELQHEFTRHGSRAPAYSSIVGAGRNSCVLHYNDNNAVIRDGDLVLIDAGCEYHYYASDITRTFPANGRFSAPQRAIYELVLTAQEAIIAEIKPGVAWNHLESTCDHVIAEGLVRLGLLQGDPKELAQRQVHKRFYMHRFGHWLGLDVHDCGAYKVKNAWRTLAPGMVFTVEPGIYIPEGSEGVDPQWWNIGVRIEDDVAVTPTGSEVLSAAVPKTVAAIEAAMAKLSQ